LSKNLELVPGNRLTFRNCRVRNRSDYIGEFRGNVSRVWRYVFICPEIDCPLVYSGKWLGYSVGDICNIKATIKRVENSHGKMMRISHIKSLDSLVPVPLYEMGSNKGE
jgi:hypothetical protein